MRPGKRNTHAYLKEQIPRISEFKGKLGNSAEILAKCLKLGDSLGSPAHRLWVYAGSRLDEDTRVGKYKEMRDRVYVLHSELGQATAYIEPEMLTIPEEKLMEFVDSNKDLSVYRFYIEDMLRRKKHIMSEEVENILALSGPLVRAPLNVWTMINNADIEFPNVKDEDGNVIELTRGRLSKLMESTDRSVRKEASDAYNDTYLKYMNGLGATLASQVNVDNFITQARDYNSTLERSLDGNNIPVEVFHNLIEAANNNLEPLHKYASLRKKTLGVDTLFGYDMSVPLVPEARMEFTYEQAKEIVLKGLEPLGKEYLDNLKMAFDSRWIDVYETLGKDDGAHSWGTYSVHPIILMNFSDMLDDVFSLAHETGHAMHSYYTNQNEPYIYAGHSLFTAEVASTCNEALVINYMLEHSKDKNEKLYLLNYLIKQFIGTFYLQIFFSEFEHKIHEVVESGGALSAESMREIYRGIYQKYYGPEFFIPENRDLHCLRIYHFYRTYYVYQYATGFAASQMLSRMILEGGQDAKEAYLEFIKIGSSDYPINILKKIGIDMTTTEPFEHTIRAFSELVDQFEELLLTN
jgi:oligoendopeptidase F